MNRIENAICCGPASDQVSREARNWLFVMDPWPSLNLETETSLLLMDALIARGQTVLWTEMHGVWLDDASLAAGVRRVLSASPFRLGDAYEISVNDVDAVLLRKDPPFDRNYLHLTYLLEHVADHVVQFNEPAALRDLNEKLLPLNWPHLSAPSITTMSITVMERFLADHGEIVVKPLDDCSGRGVIRVSCSDADATSRLSQAFATPDGEPRYLMAQAYLSEVAEGDKRVVVVDGEAVGAVNRVPQDGSFLANIHQGARVEAAELTDEESRAIAEIGPFLRNNGVILAGIDFIGGYVTEVNVTSPSAIRQINQVSNIRLEDGIADSMIELVERRKREHALDVCCLRAA